MTHEQKEKEIKRIERKLELEIEPLFSGLYIGDLDYYYTIYNNDDASDVIEQLNELINEREVIYYSVAMEYLNNNDTSLHESLNLASEYGCSLENLSSEILASIHIQDKMKKELYSISDKLIDSLDDYYFELDELKESEAK